MAAKKQRKRYNYVLTFILLILVCVMAFYSRELGQQRDAIVYPDSLELVAAEINGEELTLRELAFYVAYEEMQVEEQAVLYDSEDPGHYWNIRTQEGFTRVNARKAVMQMALHDELFYQLAQGEIELDEGRGSASWRYEGGYQGNPAEDGICPEVPDNLCGNA